MNKKVLIGGGLAAFFLLACALAFQMGQNQGNQDESMVILGDIEENNNNTTDFIAQNLVAEEMRLEQFSGSLNLTNLGEEKSPVAGSRLISQDYLHTLAESNAYLLLDSSKAVRMNQESQVEVTQEEKHFDVLLHSGSLFFHVSSPLDSEESLDFITNNVVTGVRGTSGIITYDETAMVTQIAVLTGSVVGTTSLEEKTIEAGQVGIITNEPDGTIRFEILSVEQDPVPYHFGDDFIDSIQGDLNNEGQSFPFSELLREPDFSAYETIYAPIIGQYREYLYGVNIYENLNMGNDAENNAIMWMDMNLRIDGKLSVSQILIGYEYYDIDGNGSPELIFYHNTYANDPDIDFMREVWTIQDGVPVSILQCDTRYIISIHEDGVLQFSGYYYILEDSMMSSTSEYNSTTAPAILPKPMGTLTMITAEG